jgi:hypothetical protein
MAHHCHDETTLYLPFKWMDLNGCFFTNMHYRYKDYLKVGEKAWNGLSKEILAFGKGGCPKGAEDTLSAHE